MNSELLGPMRPIGDEGDVWDNMVWDLESETGFQSRLCDLRQVAQPL